MNLPLYLPEYIERKELCELQYGKLKDAHVMKMARHTPMRYC